MTNIPSVKLSSLSKSSQVPGSSFVNYHSTMSSDSATPSYVPNAAMKIMTPKRGLWFSVKVVLCHITKVVLAIEAAESTWSPRLTMVISFFNAVVAWGSSTKNMT